MTFYEIREELERQAQKYAEAHAKQYFDAGSDPETQEAIRQSHYAALVAQLNRVLQGKE